MNSIANSSVFYPRFIDYSGFNGFNNGQFGQREPSINASRVEDLPESVKEMGENGVGTITAVYDLDG